MESSMVENYYDNERFMNSFEAISLIQDFFQKKLPEFELKNKYNDPRGYWGIEYKKTESIVKLESARGIFEPSIHISGTRYSLSQLDKRMKEIKTSSEKNILFTLTLIKRFFG